MDKKNIEVDYDFRRYVTCSECGHYLERSLFAKGTQRRCDKCGALLEYTVQGDTVTTKVNVTVQSLTSKMLRISSVWRIRQIKFQKQS